MIYQCFYRKDHPLFSEEPYVGFGLEPDVNERLFENCPELENPTNRLQLVEYGSHLWLWRNKVKDPWIGSNSYRQLDKFNHKFQSIEEIEALLEKHDILAWGEYNIKNKVGMPMSLKSQAEVCHPGLNEFTEMVFLKFKVPFPPEWSTKSSGFFANYWVMKNPLFQDFMQFSWPMVEWAMLNIKNTEYYKTQNSYGTVTPEKCVGYFLERLFIFWYLVRGHTPFNPSKPEPLFHNTFSI